MWLLIILGLTLRFYRFSQIPISLYWDEVAIGLDARSIASRGLDINNHHWLQPLLYSYGDYKAPVYIWLTSLLGKIFSVNELIIRLPSLLASLGIALILYFIVKQLSPKESKLPLLTTASFLIMPWSIHFSRIGFESHLSLFFLILAVFLIIKSNRQKKPLLLIFSALAVVLGIYSYISFRVIGPLLFIITYLIFYYPKFKHSLKYFILSLLIISLGLLVLTNSSLYQQSQFYRLSNDNLIRSDSHIIESFQNTQNQPLTLYTRLFHHRYLYKIRQYLSNYFTYFSPEFLVLSGDPNLRHHSGFGGQLLIVQGALMLIGAYAISKKKPRTILFILVWLGLSPLVAALVNENHHASRSIYFIIPLAYLIGLGWQQIFKHKNLNLLLIFSLFINLSFYAHDYFIHYPQRSADSWIYPYKKMAMQIKAKQPQETLYISPALYKPELYMAYYLNDLNLLKKTEKVNYYLPDVCPQDSICLGPPNWSFND